MSRKKVLVTGSDGQLGSSLLKLHNEYHSLELITSDLHNLDISSAEQVQNFITAKQYDFVVNCAAYTGVDKAEQNESTAFSINQLGSKNLAEACEDLKIPLVHMSTDYVFSGESNIPYIESDLTGPLTAYGRSKLAGEKCVLDSGVYGLIIRTSWLFSEFSSNFVKSMIRLGGQRKDLGVVFDQVGSPTYAGDLARSILEILNGYTEGSLVLEKAKVYHYCNHGVCSWYDLAEAVMDFAGLDCKIHPITTEEFPLPAKRPPYSVLNTRQFRDKFNIDIPHWRSSLAICINNLKSG